MPAPAHPERIKADLVLVAAAVGWAASFAAAKSALDGASPAIYLTLRFAIGTLAAALLARGALRDRDSLRYGALLGVLLFVGFALNTFGLRDTTATRSGFLTGLCVILVPVIGALAFRQRVGGSAWAGASLALLGLLVMSAPALAPGAEVGRGAWGDSLTVASAFVFALHLLYTGRFAPRVKPMAAVTAGAALLLPFEEILRVRRMVGSARQRRRGAWPACEEAVHLGTEQMERAPRLRGEQGAAAFGAGTGRSDYQP